MDHFSLFTRMPWRKFLLLPSSWIGYECWNEYEMCWISRSNRIEPQSDFMDHWAQISYHFFMKWDSTVRPKGSKCQKESRRRPTACLHQGFPTASSHSGKEEKSLSSLLGPSYYKHEINTERWFWTVWHCPQSLEILPTLYERVRPRFLESMNAQRSVERKQWVQDWTGEDVWKRRALSWEERPSAEEEGVWLHEAASSPCTAPMRPSPH